MQKVHFTVNLFYYGILASLIVLVMIAAESLITSQPVRYWAYSSEQWFFIWLTCFVNYLGMNCETIAMQNERSGFISLLGYIGVVYAFVGDLAIFNESFNWLQICAICLVLSLNIALICKKQLPGKSQGEVRVLPAAPNQAGHGSAAAAAEHNDEGV